MRKATNKGKSLLDRRIYFSGLMPRVRLFGVGFTRLTAFVASNKRIVTGLVLALLFLLVETGVHVSVLHHSDGVLNELLTAKRHETLLRLFILILFLSFAVHVQIREKERAAYDREMVDAGIEWKRTFDAIPDFVAIIDQEYRILRINKAMARQLGSDENRLAGELCYERIHGTNSPPSFCPHRKLLCDHKEHKAEIREERFGGDFVVTVSPLWDQSGRLIGCTHVAHNISERKRTESALQSSNAALQRQLRFTETLLEAEPIAVFFKDADGRYMGCNDEFSRAVGLPPEAIVGKTVFDLWPAELAEVYDRQDRDLIRKPGHQVYESHVKNAQDELRDVIFHTVVFPDENGNAGGIVGTFFDISDRKRAEKKINDLNDELERRVAERTAELTAANAALEREVCERFKAEKTLHVSEERYRTLVEQASDGIFIADVSGNYLDVNDSGCRMLGYTREQILKLNVRDLVPIPEQQALPLKLDAIRSGSTVLSERTLIRSDGTLIPVEINASMLSDGRLLAFVRDISERRSAEEALKKSEEKYRTLFEESFDGLFITSPNGRILDMNKKGVSMFGYDTKQEVLSLDLARDVYLHPPDRQRILKMVNECGVAEYEVDVKKKNGETMMAYCALTAVRDERWRIVSYRGIIRDITERKRAEAARIRADAKYRMLFEQAGDYIFLLDDIDGPEGPIIKEANNAAFEKHGYSREEMIGMPVARLDTTPPARMRERSGHFQKPGDAALFETEHVRKDGTTFFVEVSAMLVQIDGEPPFILSIERDITEQKRAKEALRDSEERYRRITAAITDYIYTVRVLDGKAIETRHGAGCRTVTGYTAEEFAADPCLWINMVAPEDRKAVEDQTLRVLAGQETGVLEHRLIRKDGEERWVRNTIVPRRSPQSVLESYDGLIQDITERKDSEKMLRNYANGLRTLSARLIEARESERRHIAHELHDEIGQCLTGVKLSLDAIRRRSDDNTATDLSGLQEELSALMVRVRNLALNLRPSLLDALGLLPTLEWHFGRYREQTGIQVDFAHDESVGRLPAEIETVIFRVVQEALTNVARHARVQSVKVLLNRTEQTAAVMIEDNGCGFDVGPAMENGRTMGLTGMRERVEGLGGTILIQSERGSGTLLSLSLPLEHLQSAQEGAAANGSETPLLPG